MTFDVNTGDCMHCWRHPTHAGQWACECAFPGVDSVEASEPSSSGAMARTLLYPYPVGLAAAKQGNASSGEHVDHVIASFEVHQLSFTNAAAPQLRECAVQFTCKLNYDSFRRPSPRCVGLCHQDWPCQEAQQAVSPCLGFGKRSDLGESKTPDKHKHKHKHRGEILLAETKSAHLVGGTKYEVPVLAPI